MQVIKTHVGPNGRMVIPAPIRKRLGIASGGEVLLLVEKNGLLITTAAGALAGVQAELLPYTRGESRISEELIEDRRLESKRESKVRS